MTFIASVVAKKGVAVIADSLATFSKKVVSYDQFMDYLRRKQGNANSNEISIDRNEITHLFEKEPSHTTDYAEKLFQFDKFTAITLAGASQIADKPIEYLIQELAVINAQDENYYSKTVAKRVKDFCAFMDGKVRKCIAAKGRMGRSILLFTHYDAITEKTIIYRIVIDKPITERIGEWKHVSYEQISDERYVVSEGQDTISRRILMEKKGLFSRVIPHIVDKITKDFNLSPESIPAGYTQQLFNEIYLKLQVDDRMIKEPLSNLSLQQAVNMAHLLLKMEIAFQTYAKRIPTVGGVIKIAVIDKHGFRYIMGHNILKPY